MNNLQKIPNTKVFYIENGDLKNAMLHELYNDKRILLFGVPGAFTPTCTKTHAPSFVENAQKFFDKSIDKIVCIAVCDPFVIKAWQEIIDPDCKLVFVSDGNGDFARAADLEVNLDVAGLGKRLKRFSCIVDKLVVNDIYIETDVSKDSNTNASAVLSRM